MVNVWTNSNEGDISPDGGADKVPAEPTQAQPSQDEPKPPPEENLQYTGNSFASAHMAGITFQQPFRFVVPADQLAMIVRPLHPDTEEFVTVPVSRACTG